MIRIPTKVALAAAFLATALALSGCGSDTDSGGAGKASSGGKGEIAVITVDLGYQYWQAEANTAKAEIQAAGYKASVNANEGDPDKQNQLIDAAIARGVKAIILDPAGADESVAAVQKATDADIPVFLVNAEISKQGIAKSQIVSNNAQGATVGAEAWVEAMGGKGEYVELFGNPTDNNAQVRSDGFAEVISANPGLKRVGKETANWNRAEGKTKMEGMLAAHPKLTGVIAGNDDMALGAIQALKAAGRKDVKVLGFNGDPDAIKAIEAGTMTATVLQPIVAATKQVVGQATTYLDSGKTGVDEEKQSLDCILITPDNTDQYAGPYELKQ